MAPTARSTRMHAHTSPHAVASCLQAGAARTAHSTSRASRAGPSPGGRPCSSRPLRSYRCFSCWRSARRWRAPCAAHA
eukprot:34435-Chlamydomonas_euryale.AAC.1